MITSDDCMIVYLDRDEADRLERELEHGFNFTGGGPAAAERFPTVHKLWWKIHRANAKLGS